MTQHFSVLRNWDHVGGEFRLEEDRQKRPLEKPHEVDEACYSLEDLSPDLDETPAYYSNGKRITEDYRRMDSERDRSLPSEECCSETALARVAEKDCEVSDREVNDANHPRTFASSRTFKPEDSGSSAALIPRGLAEFFPSEELLPDFDHLLSKESETGEESSDDVRRMCQEMVLAGRSSQQIYDEINRSRLGGKLYDLGAEDSFVLTDGSDEGSSWTEEDCARAVETMRVSAQCSDDSCHDWMCQLGRSMIHDIESDLENMTMVTSLPSRRLLSAIIDHSAICEDTACSVPWCSFFTLMREQQLGDEEMRASLQGWYRRMQLIQDFEELYVDIPDTAKFLQLDMNIDWPCVKNYRMQSRDTRLRETLSEPIPRNGIDFLVNGHFGRYAQLGLTAISTTTSPGAMMLNIVQYVSSENSLDLWRRLVGLKHPNIVRHLWVCVDDNSVTLCRDHSCMDSDSLEGLVRKVGPPHRIDEDQVITYVIGLLSATRYLNQRGIFYLRWIASGIQLNYDYKLARLSDFSSAVDSSTIEADEEAADLIVNSLPPYILPPEIFGTEDSFGRIGTYTEVWGVGCIIYHTCCHHPVHHAQRHQPHEKQLAMVEEFSPNDHLRSIKSRVMHQILSKIFTYEAERISLPALEKLLQESLSTNER